jgi:hypothetical protein
MTANRELLRIDVNLTTINLACGARILKAWINLDSAVLAGVDLRHGVAGNDGLISER